MLDTSCISREILELHNFLERWFKGSIPKSEASFSRLKNAWRPPFKLVDPQNNIREADSIIEQTYAEHGSSRTLEIRIKLLSVIFSERNDFAAATYEEWHIEGRTDEGRLCSALLFEPANSAQRLQWLYIHESGIVTEESAH